MIDITFKVELDLPVFLIDQNGFFLIDSSGNYLMGLGWYDITNDVVLSHGFTWTRGNSGRGVLDRVADIGTFTFALNNSEYNERGIYGLYSPDSPNRQERFGLSTKVRLTLYSGGNEYKEWQGKISTIVPLIGRYRQRMTLITAEDWMANAYRDTVYGITVQQNKRDDEILNILMPLASKQPLAKSFLTGDDIYTYALHDEDSTGTTLGRVFQKLAESGMGKIFLDDYETLKYVPRSSMIISGAPAAVFDNNMRDMKLSRSKSQRVREVIVKTYPVQLDAVPVVLWQAQREISLTPSQQITFDISFRDPNERAVRVAATQLTTPAANTDYKFSSTSGSGTDLNASLSITTVLKGDVATITLKNNAAVTGYLWFHQQRGLGVYLYEPLIIREATGQPDGEILTIDMVYQDDYNVGKDIAQSLKYFLSTDRTDIESITFFGNHDTTLRDAAFLPLNSLVGVKEAQSGISASYLVNGYSKTLRPGRVLEVTYYLTAANQIDNACYLDVVGMAELDSTAYLGA